MTNEQIGCWLALALLNPLSFWGGTSWLFTRLETRRQWKLLPRAFVIVDVKDWKRIEATKRMNGRARPRAGRCAQ